MPATCSGHELAIIEYLHRRLRSAESLRNLVIVVKGCLCQLECRLSLALLQATISDLNLYFGRTLIILRSRRRQLSSGGRNTAVSEAGSGIEVRQSAKSEGSYTYCDRKAQPNQPALPAPTGRVPQELVARTRDERPLPSNFSLNGAR